MVGLSMECRREEEGRGEKSVHFNEWSQAGFSSVMLALFTSTGTLSCFSTDGGFNCTSSMMYQVGREVLERERNRDIVIQDLMIQAMCSTHRRSHHTDILPS
jgi:hypothetical protein